MPQKDPSRTEKPTPKRINKARGEGNVQKSQEVGTTMGILVGSILMYGWISYLSRDLMELFRYFLGTGIVAFGDPTPSKVNSLMLSLAFSLTKMVLPVLLGIAFFAFIVQRMQVGKLWTLKPLKPNLKKMNPVSGLKRMFLSLDTFIRLGKSLLKVIIIGVAPALVIKNELSNFVTLYYADATGLSVYILQMGFKMVIYALVPMIIIAVADFFYTRWDYIEKLKMTKSEVKDEMKQMDGDPQIKSKQRQKMMQMSMRRMMKEVPKADVVITNPTHIAVALKYSAMEAPAPIVVAKGADKIAEKIKDIAREHKIPIRENKPLARALFAKAEIGEMIPEDLYQAVATILAQLWKQKGINIPKPAK
jgi:flagellar biosynthetic protein FlhB